MPTFAPGDPPARRGQRPNTIVGSLHSQCNGHGDPKYMNQLLEDVLSWPYVESTHSSAPLRTYFLSDPRRQLLGGPSAFYWYYFDRKFVRHEA
jgi:hypothetical protein